VFKTGPFFALLLLLGSVAIAQEGAITQYHGNGKHYHSISFKVKKNTFYSSIATGFTASSVSFEIDSSKSYQRAYTLLGGTEKFLLSNDAEQSAAIQNIAERSNQQSTSLLIAANPFNFISFFSGEIEGEVRLHLLFASPLKSEYLRGSKKKVKAQPVKNNL
jgi:hypothetical protein